MKVIAQEPSSEQPSQGRSREQKERAGVPHWCLEDRSRLVAVVEGTGVLLSHTCKILVCGMVGWLIMEKVLET